MKQSKVSAEFMSTFHSNTTGIEAAKAAEARLGNIPVAPGTQGVCVIDSMRFDKSPDKKQADGTTKVGSHLFEVAYRILDGENQGKVIRHVQWMWTNANTSFADQYERVLNYMEKLGLPRELRMKHESPEQLFQWFEEHTELSYQFEVKVNPNNQLDDGKYIVVYPIPAELPPTGDIVPPPQTTAAPPAATTTTQSSPGEIKPGMTVKFKDTLWTVKEIYGSGKAYLQNLQDPSKEELAPVQELVVV